MPDQPLDGSYLDRSRRPDFQAAVDRLLATCGPLTLGPDPARPVQPPAYSLLDLNSGRRHVLKTGLNTLGRSSSNAVVISGGDVSRHHCAVLVHAHGGCEVQDTASRNGTRVNGRRTHGP